MAPKYKTPEIKAPLTNNDREEKHITQISWDNFFISQDLQRILKTALDNNRDLKIANLKIESAQATHGIARSNLLPSIGATALETRQGVPSAFAFFTPKKQFRANLALTSYEVDFFGRLQSLKKSALEDFLSEEQSRNITKISLIAETANSYAQLICDTQTLEIAKENLDLNTKRFEFVKLRHENGIDSKTTLINAEISLENAKSNFEDYKKLVKQDRNTLLELLATFDEKLLPQNKIIDDIKINEKILNLTPSQSLLMRPDIQKAEHDLKSANANIGAARAAFFPSITLTGSYGYGSRDIKGLFDSSTWSFTPQIYIPIFSGGRASANLTIANARKKIEILNYEKSIQNAFREVSDQLSRREAIENQLKSSDKILKSREDIQKISDERYSAGINNFLTNVDDKIALLEARQNQINTKKEYIANLIELYKVMGGGVEVN